MAPTVTSSANAPMKVEPNTRSPTEKPVTPSPSSTTSPANSLPGMNGVGACAWYWFATTRTSGKFNAATVMRTRTWPAPTSGTGTSASSTTSGPP